MPGIVPGIILCILYKLTHMILIKLYGPSTVLLPFYLFFEHLACGILVPLQEMEPASPVLESWSLNH